MGSEAIRTHLLIHNLDDDVSKGALSMDSVGDGGAWKNHPSSLRSSLEKGSLI